MEFLSEIPAAIDDVVPREVSELLKEGVVQLVRVDLTNAEQVAELRAYCDAEGLEGLTIVDNAAENGYTLLRGRAAEGGS